MIVLDMYRALSGTYTVQSSTTQGLKAGSEDNKVSRLSQVFPLQCPECGIKFRAFTRVEGKNVPSFVMLYRHYIDEHGKDNGIERDQYNNEMKRCEETPWVYIDPAHNPVAALDGTLDAHNTVQKRIDATRQGLPRLSDAIVKCENEWAEIVANHPDPDDLWKPWDAAAHYRSISPYCIEVDPSFYLGGE